MHLVGFTIEIYYDARPYERQIYQRDLKYITWARRYFSYKPVDYRVDTKV